MSAKPELMGRAEVAEALGCHPKNLGAQSGLPRPHAKLKCGEIWLADTVRQFARERRNRSR